MPVALARFLIAALIMEFTPGPNMAWLALLSAQEGRKAALRAVAGIAVGLTLLSIAAAVGAASLMTAAPVLYEALRWGGVLFLLYLAWEAWRGEKETAAKDDHGRHFWRGVIVNLLNPKAATVFLVLIPSFVSIGGNAGELFAMNVAYLGIATLAHIVIVLFAANFQRTINSANETLIRRIFAATLAAVAIWLAISTAR